LIQNIYNTIKHEFPEKILKSTKISVILPCFNEAKSIVRLIEEISNELKAYSHEVIVVDDNSPDGTYDTVLEYSQNLDEGIVVPVLRKKDPSLAKSIRTGIEKADGGIIVVMDSDFNHQPKYIPFMIENLKHYKCVSGSRFVYGGHMGSKLRLIFSWLFNIFVRLITNGHITDSLYGFFAIKKKDIYKYCDFSKVFWGYGDYCIRLFFYFQREKVSILQFPVVNGKRVAGESNKKFVRTFYQYFTAVLKLVIQEHLRSKLK
jgi:dolichol-phosphate mannosyltransferase